MGDSVAKKKTGNEDHTRGRECQKMSTTTPKEEVRTPGAKTLDDFLKVVAGWFAYAILAKRRYIVDHSSDSESDRSGILRCTDESFNLNDYATLADFLDHEYTGKSDVDDETGSEVCHQTYRDALEMIAEEWFYFQMAVVYFRLLDEWVATMESDSSLTMEEVEDHMNMFVAKDSSLIDLFSTDVDGLIEKILSINPKILFARGKDQALAKVECERQTHEEIQKVYLTGKTGLVNISKTVRKSTSVFGCRQDFTTPKWESDDARRGKLH